MSETTDEWEGQPAPLAIPDDVEQAMTAPEVTDRPGTAVVDDPPEAPAEAPTEIELSTAADTATSATARALDVIGEQLAVLPILLESVREIARLRLNDTTLINRLHDEVTRLRAGELDAVRLPLVLGMLKLHDQMVSLGARTDPQSVAGLLHAQLLQTLELTAGVRPFLPSPGESFDPARHAGVRRVPSTDTGAHGSVAATVKAGFRRADGTIVRVAEVEVYQASS